MCVSGYVCLCMYVYICVYMCVYVVLTVLSSVRSCWLRLLDSSRRDSSLRIFSSRISRVFFRVDSILLSNNLYLLMGANRQTVS